MIQQFVKQLPSMILSLIFTSSTDLPYNTSHELIFFRLLNSCVGEENKLASDEELQVELVTIEMNYRIFLTMQLHYKKLDANI